MFQAISKSRWSGLVHFLECAALRGGAGTLELLRGVGRSGRRAAHFAECFGSSFVAVGTEAFDAGVEVSAGLCHFVSPSGSCVRVR